MPKKGSNVTLVPAEVVPHPTFWGELTQTEQKTLVRETEGFLKELQTMRRSRARAVLHLMRLKDLLYAKGHFVKYVQSLSHSSRSSYRWLNRAQELELPAPVLEAAADRGMDLIHASYFSPIKQLPPPKGLAEADATDAKVIHYLERVEALRGSDTAATVRVSSDERAKSAWRAVMREWDHLGGRERSKWALILIGRLMAAMGIPAQRLDPEAVPDEYKPRPGYPAGRPRSSHMRKDDK